MKDSNTSKCKFTTALVPYLYGELVGSEVGAFESHLPDCVECTDEFAALSSARYEVYDWKKIEFDPLATPFIRIPYDEVVQVSWIRRLRIAFSNGFAIPAVGFAGLVIVGLAGVFVWSDGNVGEVARDNANDTVVRPAVPAGVPSVPAPSVTENVKNEAEQPASVVKADAAAGERKREARPVKTKYVPVRTRRPNSTSAQVQNAPRLNDFSDDEDNSLRLAELFEDIETSD